MSDSTQKPLRGEAAWRASVIAIGKRNDAARAAGAQRRAAKEHAAAQDAARLARREQRDLPKPPAH